MEIKLLFIFILCIIVLLLYIVIQIENIKEDIEFIEGYLDILDKDIKELKEICL